ncbi:MAG TPA: M3 family oligoendopeptidase, partial [Candidatus Limnocylindria bacterium]|nr:M3 family oligoendopeptidase [Candidatus Limnocylindria bacterium]
LGDLKDSTSEVAEIHSMSMEFFTHPWMERFFGDDTEKYYYSHVAESLQFLPYGASIDEFQEWVYLNPDATPGERREAYRAIERKYLPHLDYDGHAFLEGGGRWQKQQHVFLYPFY